jgi:D-sedoheptulose 7-phosphate isomerase
MTKWQRAIEAHRDAISAAAELEHPIQNALSILTRALDAGNKILIFGNGGSAADAQHWAAELVGRFRKERKALPAIALTTDSSILTAISNDYRYDIVFSRQIEALAVRGDVVIGISTSGNSQSVSHGLETARSKGCATIGLLGRDGGRCAGLCDVALVVPSQDTARIQEVHMLIYHFLCELIEDSL